MKAYFHILIRTILKGVPIFAFFLNASAFAGPTTFGTEFNFKNKKLGIFWASKPNKSRHLENRYSRKMAEWLRAHCEDCIVRSHTGKWGWDTLEYEVTFSDGWGFNISQDPGCVEIQTFPATTEQIKEQVPRMEKYIFRAASEVGLNIGEMTSDSAHLNIGVRSAFGDDGAAFARYLADYSNRPELALGILGKDIHNAPPMWRLNRKQQKAFQEMLNKVNRKELTTIKEVSDYMNYQVYTSTPDLGLRLSGDVKRSGRHYQGIGLKQLIKEDFKIQDMPFELRAIRQPRTPQEYQLLTHFMDKKIEKIKVETRPLHYRSRGKIDFLRVGFASDLRKATQFQIYLEEMGENWKDYESLLPEKLKRELEKGNGDRILTGNIDWNSTKEFKAFRQTMVDRFYVSDWSEKRLRKIIAEGRIPKEKLEMILKDLIAQSRENVEQAQVVDAFVKTVPEFKFYEKELQTIELNALPKQGNCFVRFLNAVF